MIDGQSYNLALGSSDAIPLGLAPHRSAACCARITRDGKTGWCLLPDQHDGEHEGILSAPTTTTYGPPGWSR